jgi:predicted dehydrogenase
MSTPYSRRAFIKRTSLAAAGSTAFLLNHKLSAQTVSAGEKVRVAVIGCNSRGMQHIAGYLNAPNAEIVYICDVDSRAVEKGIAAVAKKQSRKPAGVKDLRRVLDDKSVDAVSLAIPDHWHTPAAMMACAAGKHVYVEKPGSHNLHESEMIVASARKHNRVVQMGNQRRSWPWVIETMDALHSGEIGRIKLSRCWYTNHRASIGHGKPVPVPDWLDYNLWQGPAPERPFQDNLLHYNWHWFWNYGTGELGNNGVHCLDLARWGLQAKSPLRVSCVGNRYAFQDDQQTPDTCVVSYDCGDAMIVWEGQSCDPRGFEGAGFGAAFYGEKGSLTIAGYTVRVYDLNDKLLREVTGKHDEILHFRNFVDTIQGRAKLKSPIEDGQKSTLLCHLGNISWRTGRTLNLDPKTARIVADRKASALATRQYRRGWQPVV